MKVELKEVSVGYQTPLVEGANALLESGDLVALLGRNGAGKSTLLRHLAGLLPLLSGTVLVGGQPIHQLSESQRARLMSVVTTRRSRAPQLTAFEVVGLGRSPYTNRMGRLSNHDRAVVEESLELVGISHLAHRYVSQISDGENQRVMIARALAQDTPVILLDEPTAFLDLPNRYDLALLLKRLSSERQKVIVFSTHDLDIALQLCNRIMLIHNQQLTTLPTSEMKESHFIQQLFSSDQIDFDPQTGAVHIRL